MRRTTLISSGLVAALCAAILTPAMPATAIPAPTSAIAQPASTTTQVLGFGDKQWSFYRSTAAPFANWKTVKANWTNGAAPFGFGVNTGSVATKLPNSFATKPLSSYFQHTFALRSVPKDGATLTTWADDGIVVYVNGTEVSRTNMPAGKITHASYATRAPQSGAARAALLTINVPATALKVGENLISVQVQSNWRNTHNTTFDAKLSVATPAKPTPPVTPPVQPPAPGDDTGSESGVIDGWGAPAWRDEFSYVDPTTGKPAIDSTKWNVRERSDLGLLPDAAVPSQDQVTVDSSGIAHLKAEWLNSPVIRPDGQAGPKELWHKTGYMDQRKLESGDMSYGQRFGRWEIRAKVPTGPKTYGALAAFWLRNSNSGEIDIMESWGFNEQAAPGGQRIGSATTTVHTKTSGAGNEKFFWHHVDFGGPAKVYEDFHTFAFELTPSYAAVYVDDVKIATATPETHPNLWNEEYFGSPLHVRLNLHVGMSEQYWGIPDPAHKDWTQNLDYQVDYVRIWKYEGK